MRQFIVNSTPDKDGVLRLEGSDYRYLVRVRRLAAGEYFPALLPDGEEILAQVIAVEKDHLVVKCGDVIQKSVNQRLPPIVLFQALPKGDKMDLIVRQAAEGGITEIVPFVSEFSIAKASAGDQKISRWERIIKEARQQSGSKIATVIHKPLTVKELFENWRKFKKDGSLGLVFHYQDGNINHSGVEHKSLHGYLDINPKIVVLAVGPEGGFSDKEVTLFLENGFKPVTIGDTILRTETAALYCAAAIRVILLERESWKLNKEKLDNV